MRCWGRTKNLTRCKNQANLVFCRHHRFQPLILFFTISTIVGLYAGIYQDLIRPIFQNSERFVVGKKVDATTKNPVKQITEDSTTQIPPKSDTTAPIYPSIKEIKKHSGQPNQKATSGYVSDQLIDSTSSSDHGRRGEKKHTNYPSAPQTALKPDTTKPNYRVTISAPPEALISIDDKVVGSGFVELQLSEGLHWISVQLDSLIWKYPKQISRDQFFNIQDSEMKVKN